MSQPRQSDHPIDPLFTRRWSPRAFTGEHISESTLLSLLEAARWAPSAFNAQPWRFIYGRSDTPSWQPIFDNLVEFNRGWAHRAAALIVVLSQKRYLAPGATERLNLGPGALIARTTGSNGKKKARIKRPGLNPHQRRRVEETRQWYRPIACS